MRLRGLRLVESPRGPGRARAVASVAYADGGEEALWLDVPAEAGARLASAGDAWLACLLPGAFGLGEDLYLDLPVAPRLLAGAHEVARIWHAWWPARAVPRIEAETGGPPGAGAETASFFSAGVDSFYTALEAEPPSTSLVGVGGFDVPIGDVEALARLRSHVERAAGGLERRLVWVETNLRATRIGHPSWRDLTHGAALACVAHALAPLFARVRIASTHGYARLAPFGSHPLVDPLFSSDGLRIEQHGAERRRSEKLARIADHPLVRSALRVCWQSLDESNCGRCGKCVCTLLHLDALGCLDRFATFDAAGGHAARVARLEASAWEVRSYLEDVRETARARGRADLIAAIERGLRRTRRRRLARRLLGRGR